MATWEFEFLSVKLWLFKEMQHCVQSPLPLLTQRSEHALGWSSFLVGVPSTSLGSADVPLEMGQWAV